MHQGATINLRATGSTSGAKQMMVMFGNDNLKDVVRCYKCNGRGLIYEAESHPTDPDNPSINAETCHVCMGATYLRKDRDNDN